MGIAVFLLCVVLALIFGYFGFLRPDPGWHGVNSRNRVGAVMFVILALISLYSIVAERTAPERLGDYIPPYPGATAVHVSATGEGRIWWLLHTDDPPEAVAAFYREEENRPGWTIQVDESVLLTLKRNDLELEIYATRQHADTVISYRLAGRDE